MLAFDPSTRGVVYTHVFGVQRSVDGGATFRPLSAADGFIDTNEFAIAPDGKTLYAGGSSSGVWTYDLVVRRRAIRH
jgi:hypothetical protein